MNLSDHYNKLWEDGITAFRAGHFQYDHYIDSPLDDRRGITLLIRPDDKIKQSVTGFLTEMSLIEADQYYYPISDMHTTIMSIISCYSGFDIRQLCVEDYLDIIDDCIKSVGQLKISYQGLTASASGIMIQGFPDNEELNQLRERLRDRFKHSLLEQSIDKRYSIKTAHMTVVRFKEPAKNIERLLKLLEKYRSYEFGIFNVDRYELVHNDWYQRATLTTKLKEWEQF